LPSFAYARQQAQFDADGHDVPLDMVITELTELA
jgi:hypothetical protein